MTNNALVSTNPTQSQQYLAHNPAQLVAPMTWNEYQLSTSSVKINTGGSSISKEAGLFSFLTASLLSSIMYF
jgi:hypothetical protein